MIKDGNTLTGEEIMTNEAKTFIDSQDTKHARTYREKAKYLRSKLLPSELPHPRIWWDVLKVSNGLDQLI